MGPIWGRQDLGGPHVCPMNFAIWVYMLQNIDMIYFVDKLSPSYRNDRTYMAIATLNSASLSLDK